MAVNMLNDIISDHRERMINLKKYYPFFKLIEVSFSQFKDGKYEMLDMGYIIMAVLRFFIEENNFKEKDVVYNEYLDFMTNVIRKDFGLILEDAEYKEIADYIFDKLKNDGKPFDFTYFDPVERKKKVSRVKIIESTIRNQVVWYSISSDAIEFYLDTKEIRDESKISVQQLLLEKMIRSQNFRGGVEVIARINEEVNRLQIKKNEVVSILSGDVFAGLEAYEEFVNTGMRWFAEEDKLFKKNRELIETALGKMEHTKSAGEGYYRTVQEIYELENQLKIAMNRHSDLLKACTDMQKMTDDAVRRAKLGRLRSHMDFNSVMADMIRKDDAQLLELLIKPLFKPKIHKLFSVTGIDEALTLKPVKYEEAEKIVKQEVQEIVFADEIEDSRIKSNYIFIMKNLLQAFELRDEFTLEEFNEAMKKTYSDRVLLNGDYYSFFVNLCQRNKYTIGGTNLQKDSFLDDIMQEHFADHKEVSFTIEMNSDRKVKIGTQCEISDVVLRADREAEYGE